MGDDVLEVGIDDALGATASFVGLQADGFVGVVFVGVP